MQSLYITQYKERAKDDDDDEWKKEHIQHKKKKTTSTCGLRNGDDCDEVTVIKHSSCACLRNNIIVLTMYRLERCALCCR